MAARARTRPAARRVLPTCSVTTSSSPCPSTRDRHRRSKRTAGVQRAAQVAETLLADRERHREPGWNRVQRRHRPDHRHDRGRVVPHAGADQLVAGAHDVDVVHPREHGVHVGHQAAAPASPDAPPNRHTRFPTSSRASDPGCRPAAPRATAMRASSLPVARRNRGEPSQLVGVDHEADRPRQITAVASISTSHSGRASALTTSPVETGCTPRSQRPTTR